MTPTSPIVFVVDDDTSVLRGVTRLLRSAEITAQAFASPQEFLDRHNPDAIGCVILDLAMPGLDGLQMQQLLNERGSVLPIVFLTGHGDIPSSVRAMKGGAVDFLTKPVNDGDLLRVVGQAIERCRILRREHDEIAEITRRIASLTPREHEVLAHLVTGKLNKQVAADLGTVEHTIKIHRARIMQKMQVRTFAALLRLAERAGIGVPPSSER